MKRRIIQGIAGLVLTAIALAGPSCSRDTAGKKETAKTPPGHEKMNEQRLKGIEESKRVAVAKVNGVDITMRDLINEMNQIAPRYIKDAGKRTPEIDEKVKKEALEILVFKELAIQEAVREGMKVGPGTVDEIRKKLKTSLGSEESYKGYLQRFGLTEEALGKQIERDKLFEMIAAKEIFQKAKVDEKAVRAAYEKQKGVYLVQASFEVEDVYFPAGRDASSSMDKAKEVLSIIKKNNNDISKLAQDKTFIVRKGNVTEQAYPNIYRAAAAMKAGDLSAIIREGDGLHIVKLVQRERSRQMSFEEARGIVEQKLMIPLIEKRKGEWEQALKKNARIEILQAKKT